MTEHTPTPLSYGQLHQLTANLNQNRVSTRKQGNRDLSYLEAWDVRRALIRIFGFGGFSATADEARVINTESGKGNGGTGVRITVMCRMSLYIPQLGASYSEYAAASQTGQDPGEVLDFAIKTAESDALKRCAINLGTQFGLSLYDNGKMQDVVQMVLAPHQTWPAPPPVEQQGGGQQGNEGQGENPVAVVQRVLGGQRVASEPASGVTPEQHDKNQALLERALNMKAAKDAQEDTGPAVLSTDADTNGEPA